MPTPTEAAITAAHTVSSEVRWYLGPQRGDLDEAAITGNWTPIGQAGWADRSAEVMGGGSVKQQGRGYGCALTIREESRLIWADDLAVAVIGRHYYQGAYTGWQLLAWGYLDGSGSQRRKVALEATGERSVVYVDYWSKAEVPSHQFGARNLAKGATVVGSTTPLVAPAAEAPYEYLSQDDCAGGNAIDENGDTTAISSLLADASPPGGVGSSADPRLVMLYAGRTSRTLGAGNEPLAIGIALQFDMLGGWGGFANAGAVPNLSEQGTNQPNNQYVVGTITGDRYVARILAQPGNPDAKNYVQWNVGGRDNVPIRISFDIKAGSTPSIGRFAMLQLGPFDGAVKDFHVPLSASWAHYDMDFDSSGARGVLLRFRAGRLELAAQDLYIEIANLRVWAGYCDESPDHDRLFLAYDNGAGEQRWVRLAFDLTTPTFTIAPGKILWLVDDANIFRAKFDPGDAQVIGLKNLYPNCYFNPGVGKLKLGYNTNPLRNDYTGGTDPYTGGGQVIEEINLAGYSWSNFAALMRKSPAITGAWAVESYPQASLLTESSFGPSWWQYKLPAYQPPKLIAPLLAGTNRMAVDDPDQFGGPGSIVYVGAEPGPYTALSVHGRDGDTILLSLNVATTIPVGTPIWLQWAGDRQVGHLVGGIEVRRKEGKTRIADGKVLTSILDNPTSPAPDFERGTDWSLYATFSDAWGWRATLTPYPNGPRQVAHVAPVVARMERRDGAAERAKLTELIVREYKRGAAAGGGWRSHAVSEIGSIIAHYLTQHAVVPESKVTLAVPSPSTGDLRVTPATLATVVAQFERAAALAVWADPYNQITIGPDPGSPAYTATSAAFTFDHTNTIGEVVAGWAAAHDIAQVRVTARDAETFRTYDVAYPPRPARLGRIVELRDVVVRSEREALALAEARFRQGYARRTYQLTTGPAPWLRKYMRVICDFPDLDAGGQHGGINCFVESFEHNFPIDDGGVNFTTRLQLKELAL